VDPKHSDQVVRGTVVLPHGLGKAVRVLVYCERRKSSRSAGIRCGFCGRRRHGHKDHGRLADYDAVIATPDMMKSGPENWARWLGPRGLMPNPKTGTVTFDVAKCDSGNEGRQSGISRGHGGHRSLPNRQDSI